MSTDTSQQSPAQSAWVADDEIDLRQYARVLARRWWEVALIAGVVILLTGVAVLLARALQTPAYASTATVAIIRTLTNIQFDERFTTSSDNTQGGDANARRAALVGLAYSGAIAERVAQQLGELLTKKEQNPANLLEMVEAGIGSVDGRPGASDLIFVKATADSPTKAAAIANAWSSAYVEEVNRIYGQVPVTMLGSVENELTQSRTAYEQAQAALEAFLRQSQVETLTRQIEELTNLRQNLVDGKAQALNVYLGELVNSYQRIVQTYLTAQTDSQLLAFQKEQASRQALLGAYLDAYGARAETFTAQRDRDTALLRLYYEQWLRTTANLATARTLQSQLETGGADAAQSTGLALQLLKLQLVADGGRLPLSMGDLYTRTPVPTPLPQTNMLPTTDSPVQPVQNVQVTTAPTSNEGPTTLLQVQTGDAPSIAPDALRADIAGVVGALAAQLTSLEENLAMLDETLSSGDRYTMTTDTGELTASPLADAIRTQYPTLFQPGTFGRLGATMAGESGLAAASQEQAKQLFQQAGLENLANSRVVDAPFTAAIDQIETDLRTFSAQLEVERARTNEAVTGRDVAWSSYDALRKKQAELNLARAAADSEVRPGTPAIPPVESEPGLQLSLSLAVAALGGLLLGLIVVAVMEWLGKPSLFARK